MVDPFEKLNRVFWAQPAPALAVLVQEHDAGVRSDWSHELVTAHGFVPPVLERDVAPHPTHRAHKACTRPLHASAQGRQVRQIDLEVARDRTAPVADGRGKAAYSDSRIRKQVHRPFKLGFRQHLGPCLFASDEPEFDPVPAEGTVCGDLAFNLVCCLVGKA